MPSTTTYEVVPPGIDARLISPGDILLCHRKGFIARCIRWGERLRFKDGSYWSHVAICESPTVLIEALENGVVRTNISKYRDITYVVVHTGLSGDDLKQGLLFVRTCIGQKYGFMADIGIALRFLTPGRGLWFGQDGTQICSGLAGQMLVRGWAIFKNNPASLSPAELGIYYMIPSPKQL